MREKEGELGREREKVPVTGALAILGALSRRPFLAPFLGALSWRPFLAPFRPRSAESPEMTLTPQLGAPRPTHGFAAVRRLRRLPARYPPPRSMREPVSSAPRPRPCLCTHLYAHTAPPSAQTVERHRAHRGLRSTCPPPPALPPAPGVALIRVAAEPPKVQSIRGPARRHPTMHHLEGARCKGAPLWAIRRARHRLQWPAGPRAKDASSATRNATAWQQSTLIMRARRRAGPEASHRPGRAGRSTPPPPAPPTLASDRLLFSDVELAPLGFPAGA